MWPFGFTGFCWRRFESRRKSLLHALLTMFLSSATSLSNVHTLVVIQSIIFYKFVTFSSNLPSNRFVKRTTFFRNYSFRFRLERGNSSIASFGFFIRSRRPVCVRTDEKKCVKKRQNGADKKQEPFSIDTSGRCDRKVPGSNPVAP